MAITLKDVAKRADVSVSTASAVIRRDPKPSINVNTRRRVLDAAKELNYAPNIYARLLSGGRSRMIGLAVMNEYGVLTYARQQMLEQLITQRGYQAHLRNMGSTPADHSALIQDFLSSRVEGVIAVQGLKNITEDEYNQLKERRIPVVSMGSNEYIDQISTVTIDIHKGAYLAVKHLTDLGHRRIGALLSTTNVPNVLARIQGYTQALAEVGLSLEPTLWAELPMQMSPVTFSGGYQCAKNLLQRRPDVTALFCSNDEVAIGAMKAIEERGLRVPHDISVVGFDDLPMSEYLHVPLTTVAQPTDEQGRRAVDALFHHIDQKEPLQPSHISIKPRLVVRESCAAPRDTATV